MELQDYKAIDEAIEAAEDSVVPFPVVGEELAVVGDANETQKNANNYSITFRVPNNGKYVHKTVEYKDVYITPRQDAKIVKALTTLMPYFRKVKDGDVEKLSDEEKMAVFESLGDDFYDALYDVVAIVLRVDNDLKDFMTPNSVMRAAEKILRDFPESVNEADTFFG